jgi:CRISPR-associated protein Cst2
MSALSSLSLCARITLDLHNLNNEGTEGNQQQTRMVHIIDQKGQRAIVNAISGDMFKHILVEHLVPLLEEAKQPLSPGAKVYSADRINALNHEFVEFCAGKVTESDIMTRMLADCSLTDMAGALVTRGRAVGRKSVVEFGWVVGLPAMADGNPITTTEQYFHVKYAPEGRAGSTGGDTVSENRRGLKGSCSLCSTSVSLSCRRSFPDEEGTERYRNNDDGSMVCMRRRSFPDEEGTERETWWPSAGSRSFLSQKLPR